MKHTERTKKLLSILLVLSMVLSYVPVPAAAAGVCDHHTRHTADCGYSEGSAGSACTHAHSENCYRIVACKHTHDDTCSSGCSHSCTVENGCITMDLDCHHTHGDCGYVEAVAPQDCTTCQPVLTHAENCGYVTPVAEVTCACVPGEDGTLVHTEGCGYVAPVAEVKCACEPTVTHGGEGCTYAEGKAGSPCTHTHSVKVNSADSCYKLLCSHKDGGHDDACGYVAAVEAHECHYECAECAAALTADETTAPSTEATTEPSTEATEPAPVCDCGTDDESVHATTCAVYVAPETAVCCCAEKCSDTNVWCDVCGFDYTQCGGEDKAGLYVRSGVLYVGVLDFTDDTKAIDGRVGTAFYNGEYLLLQAYQTDTTDEALRGIWYRDDDTLDARFKSTNVVSGTVNGVFIENGSVTFTGTGSLSCSGPSYGIEAAGTVTVSSGILESNGIYGIKANAIVITGGTVTAIGESRAMSVKPDLGSYPNAVIKYGDSADTAVVYSQATAASDYYSSKYVSIYPCPHESYTDGVCTLCGTACSHSGGTATCTDLAVCELCGSPYGEKATDNHTGTRSAYAPTADGSQHTATWDCCSKVETADHTAEPAYSVNEDDNTKHDVTYSCCGTFTEDHSGGEATCITPAECEKCGSEYGTVDANAHSFDETTGICTTCGIVAAAKVISGGTTTCYVTLPEALEAAGTLRQNLILVYALADYAGDFTIPETLAQLEFHGEGYTFSGTVTNHSYIHSGSFSGAVTNQGKIYGGSFSGAVTNNSNATIYNTNSRWFTLGENFSIVNNGEIICDYHIWKDGTCRLCAVTCTHTGGTATCVAKAVCETCGTGYGYVDPDAHSFDSTTGYCTNGCGRMLAVAQIEKNQSTSYSQDLAAAFAEVKDCVETDNAKITLLMSIALSGDLTAEGGVFDLDLNGKTITTNEYRLILTAGTVSIEDGTITGSGRYTIRVDGGELTVGKGAVLDYDGYESGDCGTVLAYGGSLILDGGTITSKGNGAAVYVNKNSTFDLVSGTARHTGAMHAILLYSGKVTLTGGTVSSAGANTVYVYPGTELNVAGTAMTHGTGKYHVEYNNPSGTNAPKVNFENATGKEYTIKAIHDMPVAKLTYDPISHTVTSTDSDTSDGYYERGSIVTLSCAHPNATATDNGDGTHSYTCAICKETIIEAHISKEGSYIAVGAVISDSCSVCDVALETAATVTAQGKTYDGTPCDNATVQKKDSLSQTDIPVTYCCQGGCINAGTHTASITLGNATASAQFTIAPITLTVQVSGSSFIYGDTIAVTVSPGQPAGNLYDTLTLWYGETELSADVTVNNGTYTLSYPTGNKNVPLGSSTLTVTSSDSNYVITGDSSFPVVLNAKNLSLNAAAASRAYEAGNTAVTVTVQLTGGIEGSDSVQLANKGSFTGTIESADAGENYPVTVSEITLTGNDERWYTVTQPTGVTVTITRADADAAMKTATGDLLKDGSTTVTLPALPEGAVYGTPEKNTSDITFLTVKDNVLTVTGGASVVKDVVHEVTIPVTGAKNYTDYTVTVTLTGIIHEHVWSYAASGSTITAVCSNADGYCHGKEQSITIAAEDKTYNGNPVTATLTGSIEGVDAPAITYLRNGVALNESAIHAGTYTAKITLGGVSAGVTFTISPASLSGAVVTPKFTGITYNGYAIEPGATVVLGDNTLVENTDYTLSYADNVGAGTATITVTGKGNYDGTATGTFVIIKALPAAIQWPTASSIVYGQKLSESTLTSADTNGTFAWQDGKTVPTVTNDGFVVVYTPKDTDNYDYSNVALTKTIPVTVSKAAPTVTAPTPKELTYNGAEQALVNAGTTDSGKLVYSTTEYGEYAGEIPTGKNAGEYTVWYYVQGDENHTDSEKASVKASIVKAPLSITAKALDKEYDGTTDAQLEILIEGILGEDNVTVEGITGTFSDANAGTGKEVTIHADRMKLSGTHGDNYAVSDMNSSSFATITKVSDIAAPAAGVGYTIDYGKETITVAEGFEVVDSENKAVKSGSAVNYFGTTLKVRYAETANAEASPYTAFAVAERPAEPQVTVQNESLKGKEDGKITNLTTAMEYSTDGGKQWIPAEKTEMENLKAHTTYVIRVKATQTAPHGAEKTYTIEEGKGITVTYDPNGLDATGIPAPIKDLRYDAKLTEPAAPAAKDTDFAFRGWYKDAAGTEIWDFETDTVTEETVTLYAKWEQVYFSITAEILDHNGAQYHGNVQVMLMRGNNLVDSVTGTAGSFTFSEHVEAGMYNLVAVYTDGAGEHTKTQLITVEKDDSFTLVLPEPGVNSHLSVSADSQTPDVMVGGLDEEASAQKGGSDTIHVEMTVEAKAESQVDDRVVSDVEQAVGTDTTVTYLDINVTKQVNGGEKASVSETETILEIVVPYDASGKTGLRLFRHHNGALQELRNGSGADGTFYYANGYIHIFTRCFSNYMISYVVCHTVTFDPNGGTVTPASVETKGDGTLESLPAPQRSGYVFKGWYTAASGGTQVTTSTVFTGNATIFAQWSGYRVAITETSGGTVTVDKAEAPAGTEVTITVSPKSGYRMGTLAVRDSNGKLVMVGTDNREKYGFTMPESDVTITVTFRSTSLSLADLTNPQTADPVMAAVSTMTLSAAALVLLYLLDQKKRHRA